MIISNSIFNNNIAIRNTGIGGAILLGGIDYSNNIIISNNIFTNNAANNGGAIYNEVSNVKISNNIFTNNTANNGGAIYNNGTNMRVDTCTFTNNTSFNGGAIYNNGTNMNVNNSTFNNNSQRNGGGAIWNSGSYMNVVDCIFNNNAAPNGGAIYNSGDNMGAYNCTFTNNTSLNGGAILNAGINGNVISCTFNNNNATYGGAIFNYDVSDMCVSDCIFINNTATYGGAICNDRGLNMIVATNSIFTNNTATYGGAIYNSGINMGLTDCSFNNNIVSGGDSIENYGGAIYNRGTNMNVANCTFYNNTANYGGAIYNNGTNMKVNNSTFNNNIAIDRGGAIYNGGVNMSVDNSNFNNNIANIGGAIHNSNRTNFSVANCIFSSNTANSGGAIHNEESTNLNVANSIFNNNTANSGGAICSYSGDNFIIVKCTFNNNIATSYGGAIFNTGPNMNVSDSIFNNNTAITFGGAIFNTGPNMNVSDSIFNNNTANEGGAIYNNYGNNFSVIDCDFINNTANSGGAIYNIGTSNVFGVNMGIFNCNFVNNTATTSGGAIYNNAVNISVVDSTFNNNTAYDGGAIYNNGNNSIVANCTFNNNSAEDGSAYYIQYGDNSIVTNCTFNNNSGIYSGAMWIGAYNMNISNSIFNNNSATSDRGGGAICNNGWYLTVFNCTFNDNTSPYGGAIMSCGDENLTIINCTFNNNIALPYNNIKNHAAGYGGAIYSEGGNTVVINCTFNNNSALWGGAIWTSHSRNSNLSVINSIFTSNSAIYGGAIFSGGWNYWNSYNNLYNANLIVNESVFTNNTQAIAIGRSNYELNNNSIINNTIAVQFVLMNQTYTIPDLISPSSVVNVANIIANNTYVIGISGNNSNYTLAPSSYNTSGNRNGVIFTGMDNGSTNFDIVTGNRLVNSNIVGYSGVGVTFDRGSYNNTVFNCTISYNSLGIIFNGINNIVSTSNISNNGIGVIFNNDNNTLISSNVIDNTALGINVTNNAFNNVINYNRIFNNTGFGLSNQGTSTNANFNWWGQNVINDQYTNNGSDLDLIYWYVLQLSLNTTINNTANTTRNYPKDKYATLSYELTLNNEFGNSVLHDMNLLPYFSVNIQLNDSTSVVLTFNQDSKLSYSNGSFILTHFDPSAQIRALADNEDVYLRLLNGTAFVNLTVTKVANVSNVLNGQFVTYNITVTNYGPYNATNICVIDILDPRFVLDSFSASEGNFNNGVWNIDGLNAGASETLTIVVRINGTGNITNYVYVTVYQDNIGDFSANETVYATPAVNLTIVKSVNITGNGSYGWNITYYINVTNHGPDNATGLNVTDKLDPKLVYINSNGTYNNNTGLWTIDNLNVGENAILEIYVWINATGNITNTADIIVDQINIGNNSTNFTLFIPTTVNLTIIKTMHLPDGENTTVGSLIIYTITITNNGPDNATGVVVTDILDPRLVYINNTAERGTNYVSNTGLWTIGNLNVYETIKLEITVRINGTGNIDNIANVTVDQPNVGNNTTDGGNNTTVELNKTVNLTIIKNINNTDLTNGDNITYTITVTNNGPDNANNVIVTDILDLRLIFNGASLGGSYNSADRSVSWLISNLNVGESINLTFNVTINGPGIISNIANVTTNEINIGNNYSNNLTVSVRPYVNLSIIKTASTTNPSYEQEITYTITVINHGPDNANNVIVTDILDPRLVYISNSNITNVIHTNSTIIWNIGGLANGQIVILNITVRVNGTGNINNFANVSVDEINVGNNSTDVTVTVVNEVNLTVTKTASVSEVVNGQTITYTIVVTNNGPDGATNVTVIEILDSKLVLLSNVTTQGNYDGILWVVGSLANGNSATLTLVVRVNGTGIISNNVAVSSITKNIGDDNASVVVLSVHNTSINLVSNFSEDGKVLFMAAKLVDELGNPLSGRTIDFYVQYISITDKNGVPIFTSEYVGSAITDINGVAQLNYTNVSRFNSGDYLVTASFNGDGNYPSSFDTNNPRLVDDEPSDNPVPPNDPKNKNNTNNKNNLVTGAEMKNTGMDLTAILLVLISLFGVVILRKQK